jgi:hypothetical protein
MSLFKIYIKNILAARIAIWFNNSNDDKEEDDEMRLMPQIEFACFLLVCDRKRNKTKCLD